MALGVDTDLLDHYWIIRGWIDCHLESLDDVLMDLIPVHCLGDMDPDPERMKRKGLDASDRKQVPGSILPA